MKNIFKTLIFVLFLNCQLFDNPKNLLINEKYNTKRSLKAIIFVRTGNATVNSSIHVSIYSYDYKLGSDEVGNVFIADNIGNSKLFKNSFLKINWKDNKIVEISYPENLRIFKQEIQFENRIGKVEVRYKKLTE